MYITTKRSAARSAELHTISQNLTNEDAEALRSVPVTAQRKDLLSHGLKPMKERLNVTWQELLDIRLMLDGATEQPGFTGFPESNTIILWHGYQRLFPVHGKNPMPPEGYSIIADEGFDPEPQELQRWPISQKAEAVEKLASLRCTIDTTGFYSDIEEYALEYVSCDDDGEFICSDGYDFAAYIMKAEID